MKRARYTYLDDSWFDSLITQRRILRESCGELLPRAYYHLLMRDDERIAIALEDCPQGYASTLEDAFRLVRDIGRLKFVTCYYKANQYRVLEYREGRYSLDGTSYDESGFRSFLADDAKNYMLLEYTREPAYIRKLTGASANVLNLVVLNKVEEGRAVAGISDAFITSNARKSLLKRLDVAKGAIVSETGKRRFGTRCLRNWKRIRESVESAARCLSQFELLQFAVLFTEDGFVVYSVYPSLLLPDGYEQSAALKAFRSSWESGEADLDPEFVRLREDRARRDERNKALVSEKHRTGMRPYMASAWEQELECEYEGAVGTEEEIEAIRREGFLAFRTTELGVGLEVYAPFVSDYDYHWINRINNDHQVWIEDKLAMRYALSEWAHLFPRHYLSICRLNGRTRILPLHDFPQGEPLTYGSLFKILKDRGCLAVKRSYGTHGDGFNKLEYVNGEYLLNGEAKSEAAIVEELFEGEGRRIVTEYVQMGDWARRFYPHTLNTVRVNAFQRLGEEPQIGGCFMRIGHSGGGYTDNLNAMGGGICVRVDKRSGTLSNPEFKRGNSYSACPVHPDTGVPIEGTVPRWDQLLGSIKAICASMPQLEYFGFDVALTSAGIKIIEINVFPDYTKFVMQDGDTQQFLREKLLKKYRRHRIDLPEKYRAGDAEGARATRPHRYKISVVMPVYGAEKWLRTAVDSVIDQVFGFKENVQIVLVDDGSPDGSGAICDDYARRFPHNIACIHKSNGGVSSARNAGLQLAEGEFVTFMDSDDCWSHDAFRKVWDFLEEHAGETDLVACRKKCFEASTGYTEMDFRFREGDQVVSIFEKPDFSHVNVSSTFVRTAIAREHRFPENLVIGEDARFINEIILESGAYGLLAGALYYQRKRDDGSSLTQNATAAFNASVYTDTVTDYYEWAYDYSLRRFGEVIPYVQHLVMNAVRYRASAPIPEGLPEDVVASYRARLERLVKRTDIEVLTGLRGASIGAKANVLNIYGDGDFAEHLSIEGAEAYYDGVHIGALNTATPLAIDTMEAGSKTCALAGNILLPWFIDSPRLQFVDESGEVLGVAELAPNTERKHFDMYGNPNYVRYFFEIALPASHEEKVRVQIVSKHEVIPVEALPTLKGNARNAVKGGRIHLMTKSVK